MFTLNLYVIKQIRLMIPTDATYKTNTIYIVCVDWVHGYLPLWIGAFEQSRVTVDPTVAHPIVFRRGEHRHQVKVQLTLGRVHCYV